MGLARLRDLDLTEYHRRRDVAHQPFRSACYAPFVGMSFDMNGSVSVCAFTRTTPLGQVGSTPLLDMWRGSAVAALRDAVVRDDLAYACTRCAEEIAGGNVSGSLAAGFDQFPAARVPEWPTRMEFALTNQCNLQCVMCAGEFSSSIRSRREGLPVLPQRYDAAFIEELTPFLVHLDQARFLGGEPFLADINFRIWERMIEVGATAECNVTTNGTQWTPRIERVLEALPFSIGVSVDGFRPETVESIRSGVDHGRLLENLGRFVEYRDRSGSSLSLTYCLMVPNADEFVDFLVFADGLDCDVFVNTVRQPPELSPYLLGVDELAALVGRLERQRASVGARLGRNAGVLDGQLERLAAHLDGLRDGDPELIGGAVRTRRSVDLLDRLPGPEVPESELVERIRELSVDGVVDVVRADEEDCIVEGRRYAGLDLSDWTGAPASTIHPTLAGELGLRVDVLASRSGGGSVARVLAFADPGASPTVVLAITQRGPSPWSTTRYAAVLERGAPLETSVTLG
ncbi:MAG: radical SAM protein [Microthrixaceae bacterium]